MVTPVYVALPSTLRTECQAAFHGAGIHVGGHSDTIAQALTDPALISCGVLLYLAAGASQNEVEEAVSVPYDGPALPHGRVAVAALEPTDGPPAPTPGYEHSFLFLPVVDRQSWVRTIRNVTATESSPSFRVVTVGSPYGGAGKTTVTLNLAATLQFDLGVSTIVLDFASEGPLLRHLLPERTTASLLEVARAYRRGNSSFADALRGNLVQFAPPRSRAPLLLALAPPMAEHFTEEDPDGRLYLDVDFYREVINAAQDLADVVLIDSSQDRFQPGNRVALGSADLVIVPVEPGLTYMREWPVQLPSFMNAVTNNGRQNRAWVRLLPNKVQPQLHRSGLELLATAGISRIAEIPFLLQEYAAPFEQLPPRISVLANPHGQLARIFRELALAVAQGHVARQQRRIAAA